MKNRSREILKMCVPFQTNCRPQLLQILYATVGWRKKQVIEWRECFWKATILHSTVTKYTKNGFKKCLFCVFSETSRKSVFWELGIELEIWASRNREILEEVYCRGGWWGWTDRNMKSRNREIWKDRSREILEVYCRGGGVVRLNRDGPDRSDQSLSAADKLHTHSLHHAHRRPHHHHAHRRWHRHHAHRHHHQHRHCICVLVHFIMEGTLSESLK